MRAPSEALAQSLPHTNRRGSKPAGGGSAHSSSDASPPPPSPPPPPPLRPPSACAPRWERPGGVVSGTISGAISRMRRGESGVACSIRTAPELYCCSSGGHSSTLHWPASTRLAVSPGGARAAAEGSRSAPPASRSAPPASRCEASAGACDAASCLSSTLPSTIMRLPHPSASASSPAYASALVCQRKMALAPLRRPSIATNPSKHCTPTSVRAAASEASGTCRCDAQPSLPRPSTASASLSTRSAPSGAEAWSCTTSTYEPPRTPSPLFAPVAVPSAIREKSAV